VTDLEHCLIRNRVVKYVSESTDPVLLLKPNLLFRRHGDICLSLALQGLEDAVIYTLAALESQTPHNTMYCCLGVPP
jgi:hypothetical protein